MVVEERFHRISKDIMEITVTIDDPIMYTAKWKPLNNFRMKLLPETFDPLEDDVFRIGVHELQQGHGIRESDEHQRHRNEAVGVNAVGCLAVAPA